MEYAFEFGGFPEDVLVTVSGVGRVASFGRLFEDLTESPQFEPGMRILLDLTRVDMTTFPGVDAPEIGRGLEALQDRCEGCSIAVVGDDPLTRTLIEMAELGSTSGMDVFQALSRAEAAAWLQLKRALTERSPA
jgi:hypothetical protein